MAPPILSDVLTPTIKGAWLSVEEAMTMASMLGLTRTSTGLSVQCSQRTFAASVSAAGPLTSAIAASSARGMADASVARVPLPDPSRADQRDPHLFLHPA